MSVLQSLTRRLPLVAYAAVALLLVPVLSHAARDGNGGYQIAPNNAFSNPLSGGTLTASDAAAVWSDIETAIAGSVAADGQTTMSGALKMGSNKITGLTSGTARTDAASVGQVQDSGMQWGGIAGGTGNALTLSVTPAITAYADGQTFWFVSSAANTGAATANVNSVGVKSIVTRDGDALVSGDIAADSVYAITYYNGSFYLWSPLDDRSLYAALASANTFTAAQTTSVATAGAVHTFTSSEAGASEAAVDLYRNSASPAASDVPFALNWKGEDSAGNTETYAKDRVTIGDATSTSEDATREIQTVVAGTLATRVTVGQGVTVGSATGGDPGAGKVNATGYEVNGVALANSVLQRTYDSVTGPQATSNEIIPHDDTTPTSTEGTQLFSRAITPKSATSQIRIEVEMHFTNASGAGVDGALVLFRGTTAIAVAPFEVVSTGGSFATLNFEEASGGTSARTYSLRYGTSTASVTTVNNTAAGDYGNLIVSSMTIEEYLP